ncbi:MAG: SMI1/KNR4 family protein [Eubacteriales bacterium]
MEEIKKMYTDMFEVNGIGAEDLMKIENSLNVKLPLDFKEIASFFNGGYIGGVECFEFLNSRDNTLNIIDETKRLRKDISLPTRFVFLAEPSESVIFMDCDNMPRIIWCDSIEIENLQGGSFVTTPDEFDTYTEFFRFLLEEEKAF